MSRKTSPHLRPPRCTCAICSSVIGVVPLAVVFCASKSAVAIRLLPCDNDAYAPATGVDTTSGPVAGVDCARALVAVAATSIRTPRAAANDLVMELSSFIVLNRWKCTGDARGLSSAGFPISRGLSGNRTLGIGGPGLDRLAQSFRTADKLRPAPPFSQI